MVSIVLSSLNTDPAWANHDNEQNISEFKHLGIKIPCHWATIHSEYLQQCPCQLDQRWCAARAAFALKVGGWAPEWCGWAMLEIHDGIMWNLWTYGKHGKFGQCQKQTSGTSGVLLCQRASKNSKFLWISTLHISSQLVQVPSAVSPSTGGIARRMHMLGMEPKRSSCSWPQRSMTHILAYKKKQILVACSWKCIGSIMKIHEVSYEQWIKLDPFNGTPTCNQQHGQFLPRSPGPRPENNLYILAWFQKHVVYICPAMTWLLAWTHPESNQRMMPTREENKDELETSWNILKHLETSWNILKHLEAINRLSQTK